MNPYQHSYFSRDGEYYAEVRREYDREYYDHSDTRDWNSSRNFPPELYPSHRESVYYDSSYRGRGYSREYNDQFYRGDYPYRNRPTAPEYHQAQRDSVYYDDDRRQGSGQWNFYHERRYDDRDSERDYGNPWRSEGGRNSEGRYGIPEKGSSNYMVPENVRGREKNDYYNGEKPRVPYWKASAEREPDYNMLDTRSGHKHQMKEGQTARVPKKKQLNTEPHQSSMKGSCDNRQPKEKGPRSSEVKVLCEQEMPRIKNVKETTNTARSGNKGEDHERKNKKITGNVQNLSSSENTPSNFSNTLQINCSSKVKGDSGKLISCHRKDSRGPSLPLKEQKQSSESTQRNSTREKEGVKCTKTKNTNPNDTRPSKPGGKKGDNNKISENVRSKSFTTDGSEVEMEHLKRLSALTLASNDEQG